MVATMLSVTANAWGLDRYLSPATAAHDQANPEGPSRRVEYCSTIGDCRPETFLADVGRTRADYAQTRLDVETYHLILSHSHEELDPDDPYHVWLAHEFAKEAAAKAFPGRQIKVVTQADNGRWEQHAESGERVWVKGKIHSHCQIANVAEEAVTLAWTDRDGNAKAVHYPAGRAVSSDMKNIYRIQHQVTDALVRERFAYDNEAYMQACRAHAKEGNQVAGDRKALARQADGTTNAYDELRMRLRIARAQATSWEDYEARLAADGVHTLVRTSKRGGEHGVSYKWIDASGTASRPARAGGRSGVGDEFKHTAIVEQCERNAAAVERGETLEAPDRVLVVPTSSVAADRPRPVYLTDDGRPPWEDEHAQAEYLARVRATGGTYEGRAAAVLVTGEGVDGVELTRDGDAVTATVDVGAGPLVMDVEPALAARTAALDEREAAIEDEWARLALITEEAKGETVVIVQEAHAEADAITASAKADARTIRSTATKDATATTLQARRQAEEIVSDAEADAGQIRAKAQAAWERDEKPRLVEATKAGVQTELAGYKETRKSEIDKELADYEADRKATMPEYDPKLAVQAMQAARFDAGERRTIPITMKDGTTRDIKANDVLDQDAKRIYARQGRALTDETVGQRAERVKETLGKGTKDVNRAGEKSADREESRWR
ncbi:ATP synthase F0 subunit B [Gordonia sp. 852002-10350_SCH5691597]|uniref:ATP synthase F0 subunit B n=1 Tax=Gordonia sp. 852002-10350_SCH5691597 TaxID=1834085 RepID=UPI0007E96E50|nr:ATP synthase F0 subunit B [Gordonia sp. 852002-10350_SCH5691597]OBA67772.1 hypothetical protein A5777_16490 [Gordonia sp. 852002-10350_SCH5691597]